MTDLELIKRLHDFGHVDAYQAADRIEQLVKERDDYAHKLMEANNTYTGMHVEIERLSDKLAKVVEALTIAKQFLGHTWVEQHVNAVLAELEGK
ncbi:hypothetical protein UFOVP3_75 [uncultured Caudovirales phage]|uniref:Uncharacterized protein n=1 Tax=uncultured Caudovirales phage TaxID=2100421 RepID=A0A6J5T7Z7_9CAUD|nr:hypothetical protein UFOVP3_75 [uncultured Caudovirales phage]